MHSNLIILHFVYWIIPTNSLLGYINRNQ